MAKPHKQPQMGVVVTVPCIALGCRCWSCSWLQHPWAHRDTSPGGCLGSLRHLGNPPVEKTKTHLLWTGKHEGFMMSLHLPSLLRSLGPLICEIPGSPDVFFLFVF